MMHLFIIVVFCMSTIAQQCSCFQPSSSIIPYSRRHQKYGNKEVAAAAAAAGTKLSLPKHILSVSQGIDLTEEQNDENDESNNGDVTTTTSFHMYSSTVKAILMAPPLFSLVLLAATNLFVVPHGPEVQHFTSQEWLFAMKDGYLNVMISHYIRNGGI